MLQTFLPLFIMTFFICLFIVLMQFLWRYVDDLVGKGLGVDVLMQLFFYASLTFVPMALPLGVLLASLMVFGNLGESLELLAMKASGISLMRIMKPLTVFMICLAVGTFFFQDRVLPYANTKMYSILLGIKHKSPELEIPEGVFYKEINDYNIYVQKKNWETGTLYGVTIYIFDGMNIEDAMVTVADSGKIQMAPTGQHLMLTLWNGNQVGTFKQSGESYKSRQAHPKYRRESFTEKIVYVPYENDFEATDEDYIADRHVGKNLEQLIQSVDSLDQRIDSINRGYGVRLKERTYFTNISEPMRKDSVYFANPLSINIDSIYASLTAEQMQRVMRTARNKSMSVTSSFAMQKELQSYEQRNINYHSIEIHRKFVLSFGCLIFFFIGAPLGAIIRKGGLGVPVIVSVFFFIIYYVIDNTGYKAAKEGEMEPWLGIWLSSFILAPIGVFLTWRAINDAPLFDWDTYKIRSRHAFTFAMRQVKHVAAVTRSKFKQIRKK